MKIKREFSIVLFILLATGLLVFGYYFLKGRNLFEKPNVYRVVYRDIAGVTGASPVYYNGLKVGQVIRTQLMPDGSGRIAVSFQLSTSDLKLTKDTEVQIYSADLFTRAIQIHLGTSTELAQSGDTLKGNAQLSLTDAVGEQIDPLKAKAESMIASVDSVLISFQQLMNPKAVSDIDSSFTSVRDALASLSRTAERLDRLVEVESITLTATLKNMETVSATLARNSDEMDHIFTNLDTLSRELAHGRLRQVLDELALTSAELKKAAVSLNNSEGTMGKLLHDDSLYTNLNAASKDLDLLLEDLRVNPNRYLSIFGKKDRLPKLSNADIERIGKVIEEKK
ncbi:MAG TPA: MlaD family protein [Flavobacteriales bacterium]|jgi:phospholipid/cholesterol/gamma-HCH transport system substrate-binding protein|nr:MCE family protein [Flavobacteriales bacterium]MBK7111790.1 MCE family protein [Flavobacteriales bacterium]MBK8531978.1 MCE family protein [Flavobacteriales bacterium]MBK8707834.1 MCE family protein [Flavobacteriales bacterium]MBP8877923.1 MCE family protein [Flavobacteriales bacterium]